jgi:predicted metal-dependent peptidase
MDARIEKKRLLEAIPIEQEVLDEAILAIKESRRYLGLGPSVITSIVVGLCHFTFTRTIDTFAVKLASDGNPMLMINPDFLIKIGPQQAVFALSHEAYHLLLVHLYTDPELMKNQNWVLATEACINYRIKKHLKLPLIQIDGKVVIVDPDKIYDSYRQGMKKIEKEPVSKDDFYATDIGCFAHLEGLPKPISSKQGGCVHFSDSQNGNGNAPLDPTEVSKFMDKVLSGAIQSAKNGRQGAKEEILNWMDSSPEASQTWGDLGAGTLRGETTKSRKTDLWEKWTSDVIGSKLRDGNRWKYNRKIHWDPRVSANGKQPHKHGAVFIDASGSMHQEVLDRVSGMIGDLDNITVEWHSFDGSVWPFATGEGFKGGGGTSFHIIEDHIVNQTLADGSTEYCCDDDLDFVLVITDGYAPELLPSDPDKWIWLIVPGGTTWPLDAGMSCREIDPINS